MKTIIGFDSWTQGAHHFERLVPAMKEEGYKLILIHVGSWGHDLNRPDEEMIGNLLVRDISYYKGLSFPEILKKESPSGVLFLSMQAYAHRAFNRYCKYLNIPTMHLYHGLVNVQVTSAEKTVPVNWISQASIFYTRIFDNIIKILPIYINSLLKTKGAWAEWMWFIKDIGRKIKGTSYSGEAAPDTSTDICCVYAEVDISHAVQRYGMPFEKVKAVGNPDFYFFGLKESMINSYDIYKISRTKDIIYIDTALFVTGTTYKSHSDFINHLKKTSISLQKQGYKLLVKLHPAHFSNGVQEALNALSIEVCEKEEFINRLLASSGVIVEPSSAAIIPALMGLPVLLAQYGNLSQQNYGEVLCSYPRSRILKDVNKLHIEVKEIQRNINSEICSEWILNNTGPMPSEDMPKRVMEVFKNIMDHSA